MSVCKFDFQTTAYARTMQSKLKVSSKKQDQKFDFKRHVSEKTRSNLETGQILPLTKVYQRHFCILGKRTFLFSLKLPWILGKRADMHARVDVFSS